MILESITLGVSFLKLCTFVPPRRSLQYHTWLEFAAKFLKYSSVHLHFILVWAIMMKKYAGTETLHNNEDMDKMFSTKKTTRKIYDKKVSPESLMITHVFEWSKNIFKM